MADSIHEMSRQLGEIQGTLGALARAVEQNARRAEMQDTTLRAINAALTEASRDVKFMRVEIDDMKPVTDDVKKWRTIGVGVITMTGLGAAWVGSNGAWVWSVVTSFFKQHT